MAPVQVSQGELVEYKTSLYTVIAINNAIGFNTYDLSNIDSEEILYNVLRHELAKPQIVEVEFEDLDQWLNEVLPLPTGPDVSCNLSSTKKDTVK